MDDSPYRSPETPIEPYDPYSPADAAREGLRRVAKYQRWVLYALLANIAVNIGAFAVGGLSPLLFALVMAVAVAVVAFTIAAVFALAREVFDPGTAVLCAFSMFFPCISLVVLLVVNQKATGYLQRHGVRVGLMGADPNRI